jgi:2-polyprenyl-3-methyl-5-hydroxy-6-metoxy-1,4-benzoquinol methylase
MPDSRRFDEAAATWDALPRRVELARAVAAAIARKVPLSPDLDLLDFGCGTGLVTLELRPLVRSATGADTSGGMLEILAGKARESGQTIETLRLDPENLESLVGRYHLIVSSMALHHVADLAPLFRRFLDRLHPRGSVALADLDREDGSFHEDGAGVFHQGFEREVIRDLLAEAGFVDIEIGTATVTAKGGHDYPIFLATGRKPG